MKVRTLFSGISSIGKPNLYVFVMQLSKDSEGMIQPQQHSLGMVEDLCEILHVMDGVKVASLIGRENRSWVIVHSNSMGISAFLDIKELSTGSPKWMGLTGFFAGQRTFLDHFSKPASQFTPLVTCFDREHSSSGVQQHVGAALSITPAERFSRLPPEEAFPWAASIDRANSDTILHNVMSALVAYAFACPVNDLIFNAQRFFLMRSHEDKVVALVDFVNYEHCWIPIGKSPILNNEEQFSIMINSAGEYGTATEEITRRLLIYFARFCYTEGHGPLEPEECYMWQTSFDFQKGDSLIAALLREKRAQESKCYHLRTNEDTILSIILEQDMAIYRGLLVTDTHPSFGSVIALRTYLANNMEDMLKETAAGTEDIGEIRRLLSLWELLFKFVVDEVGTYMTKCNWMARSVFLSIISMYKGKSEKMDLSTFLRNIHSNEQLVSVSGDIAIMGDLVFFLMMPTTAQCLSAKAFHAVMAVDGGEAGSAISNNVFQTFLARTYASECEEIQEACRNVTQAQVQVMDSLNFSFPTDVNKSDKATLYSLLKFRGLHHLLALSPFVPRHMSWVGAVVTEERDNIFALASEASLVGMTTDLVVFVLNNNLYVTVMNGVTDSAVGFTLITEVVNAYNMLASNITLGVGSIKYTINEVVMLFRIFNVGYRETKSCQQVINSSHLRKAMVHALFGIHPTVTCYLEAVWLDAMDFLLSGAISHQVHLRSEKDGDLSMNLQISDICLDTMLAATHALYCDRVQVHEVVSGSIYFLQRGVSSTFMVALAVMKKHEHFLRNVELKGVNTDPATVGILASIIVKGLGLQGELCTINHMAKIYNTLLSRHTWPNPIPFIVRQILRVLWTTYQGQLYFPNVEPDNKSLISTWERNIANESMPFSRRVISVVMMDGQLNDSTLVALDPTLSVILQNGIGSEKETTGSMLVTDWPLTESWQTYSNGMECLLSALNAYKKNVSSHPVSSLMQLDQTLAIMWAQVKDKQTGMQALLPKGMHFFVDSVLSIVNQITDKTDATRDVVVKVLDKAGGDDNVSLVTEERICAIKLLPGKEQKSIIVISGYPFALLDNSIVLPFNNTSQIIELTGAIGQELLWISGTLMGIDGMVQDANVIQNNALADWLLACMPMIPVEKQKRVSFLCLSGLLGKVHSFWEQNRKVVEKSVVHAVKQVTSGKVTKEARRKFLQEVFTPLMDNINRKPNMSTCILLDTAFSCHYYVMCTENNIEVGILDRGDDNKAGELTKWLEATKALLHDIQDSSSLEVFINQSRINGAPPVAGDATRQLFVSMPVWLYRQDSHTTMMDSVIRGSVLNAWTRDVPALEMYTKPSLIAAGQILATVPCIDVTFGSGDCFMK